MDQISSNEKKPLWAKLDGWLPLPDFEKGLSPEADAAQKLRFMGKNDLRRRRAINLPAIIVLPSLLANLLFVFYIYLTPAAPAMLDLDYACARHATTYRSPLDEHVPISYHSVKFNSTWKLNSSLYAAPPSPAVDNAWYDLGIRANHFTLPEHIDPTPYGIFPWQAKRDKDLGGGYVVFTEALHQLHCLNMLRKVSHWDFDHYYDKKKDEPSEHPFDIKMRIHTYHCIDMLRERIQCSADRAVFGMVWITDKYGSPEPGAFPQYSTERKCQDFDGLSHWVKTNTLHENWQMASFQDGDRVFGHDSDAF